MRHLRDICETAYMLGCHLARAEANVMPGLPKITVGPYAEDKASSDTFHASAPTKSIMWVQERHELAVKFVKQFYCSNTITDQTFSKVEWRVPIPLPLPVRLAYVELDSALAIAGKNVYALPDNVRQMLATGVDAIDEGTRGASEVLSIRASANLLDSVNRSSTSRDFLASRQKLGAEEFTRLLCLLKRNMDKMMWLVHLVDQDQPRLIQPKNNGKYAERRPT